jgi:hypothetical protein
MFDMCFSELEKLVRFDMFMAGYDANDPLDVEAYWESRLS